MSSEFSIWTSSPFPHDTIPDGATWAPHHLYLGVLVATVALFVVWNDYRRAEPWILLAALLGAAFAFATVWRYYHVAGALLTLALLVVALAAPVVFPFWRDYAWIGPRGAALVGVLVSLDDAVEHAFGVWTPLDWFWKAWLAGAIQP